MPSPPILSLRGVRKSFCGLEVLRGLDLALRPGERHALVGPRGAGKSTVFRLIAGCEMPCAGEIVFDGRRIDGRPPQEIGRLGLARSFQSTNIFPRLTVYENLRMAVIAGRHRAIRDETERLLVAAGLDARADIVAGDMWPADQRALEIAMTLASDPKVILLDEPMAGMSAEEVQATSRLIRRLTQGRAVLIVEHGVDAVLSISDRISVLAAGQIVASGTPDEMRANATAREACVGEEATA